MKAQPRKKSKTKKEARRQGSLKLLFGDSRGMGGTSPVLPNLLKTAAVLLLTTLVSYLFYDRQFSEANIITVSILGILLIAMITEGRIYSLTASACSVLIFNFFFTMPRFTLSAYDTGYPVTFIVMLLAAFVTSTLVGKLKQYARQAVRTSFRTKTLLETNQLLQGCQSREQIAEITAGQLAKLLNRNTVFYLAEEEALRKAAFCSVKETAETVETAEAARAAETTAEEAEEAEEAKAAKSADAGDEGDNLTAADEEAARWVLHHNRRAGAGTDTMGEARYLFLAVRISDTVYGVAGIGMDGEPPLEPFENDVALSLLGESAMALESRKALEEKASAALLAKNEQLRANLLRSISHDLRSPLTAISGNAGILLSSPGSIEEDKKRQLYRNIYEDSLWLINLVENLLSVTRIEDGTMVLHTQVELIDEIIDEALRHVDRYGHNRQISVSQSEEFILVQADPHLIVQVIVNIVDNALKYTPEGTAIDIRVRKEGAKAVVSIADRGDGLSGEAKERVFEMFYTANTKIADSRRSLGLGLALCKSIINAHGGEISVYDNKPKGAVFEFSLPAEEVTLHE